MNSKELKALSKDAAKCYREYDYAKALNKINQLLNIDKDNKYGIHLKACILIDSWDRINQPQSQIMEAISYLKILLNDGDTTNRWVFLGNMGNAYSELAKSQLGKSGGSLNEAIIDDIFKAKDCYQESLGLNQKQPHLWINKGNLLNLIGRYLEAIDCYDRAILIDHKHCNSWGNRGLGCQRLSKLVTNKDDKKLLYGHGLKYIAIELMLHPNFDISNDFKKYIEDLISKNNIKLDLDKTLMGLLPKRRKNIYDEFNISNNINLGFDEFFNKFCEEEGFFLNLHFDCNNCGSSRLDLIPFSFISSIDEHKSEYSFFKRLYNILDDYSTARFLLALAQFRGKDFRFLDKQRYEPDYSLNYIHNVELLKESFIKIVNTYDKIAFFLKDYEKLIRNDGKEIDESGISFFSPNSIFDNSKILENNNYQTDLIAMNSIRIDFDKGEFKNIKNIRNYLVHRYFILHDIVDPKLLTYPYTRKGEQIEDLQYHEDVNKFYRLVKNSLRLLKNTLFSLSFYVQYKENQKKSIIKGPIVDLYWSYDTDTII